MIKFRAWHKGVCYKSDDLNEFPELWMFWRFVCRHLITDVEQFTGYKDKKNGDIYDQDRAIYYGHTNVIIRKYTDRWEATLDDAGGGVLYPLDACHAFLEIIGSIHDKEGEG